MRVIEEVVERGVSERRFDVVRRGRPIPGLLWTPAASDRARPLPLVLIGHGASGTKREPYVVAMGRRLARHQHFAAAAIDGPVHGDRRSDHNPPGLAFLEFSQRWASDPTMTDEMVADWQTVLDRLQDLEDVGRGAVGFWGLSMGTILGLPLVAAEPRIKAAVLGLMGMTGPTRARIEADAPAVNCPVLFVMQLSDELFPRQTALELFDALGTADKVLHAHPGPHGAVPGEEFDASEHFLASRLAPVRPRHSTSPSPPVPEAAS